MRTLWRLHIRPYGGHGDIAASVALCLDRSIIGMGWAVPKETVERSADLSGTKPPPPASIATIRRGTRCGRLPKARSWATWCGSAISKAAST